MGVDDLGAGGGVFVGGGEEESDFIGSVVIAEDVPVVADPHAVPFAGRPGVGCRRRCSLGLIGDRIFGLRVY